MNFCNNCLRKITVGRGDRPNSFREATVDGTQIFRQSYGGNRSVGGRMASTCARTYTDTLVSPDRKSVV